MSENLEYVEVTLKVPKGVVEFLKEMGENVEEYLTRAVVCDICAGLEGDDFWDPKHWVEKHKLMPIFNQYKALPSSYIAPREKDW